MNNFFKKLALFIPASNLMAVPSVCKRGAFFGALFRCIRATCSERASRGHIERAGNISFKNDTLAVSCYIGVGNGDCGKERLGVGMQGICIKIIRICDLYDLSEIHNRDPF